MDILISLLFAAIAFWLSSQIASKYGPLAVGG